MSTFLRRVPASVLDNSQPMQYNRQALSALSYDKEQAAPVQAVLPDGSCVLGRPPPRLPSGHPMVLQARSRSEPDTQGVDGEGPIVVVCTRAPRERIRKTALSWLAWIALAAAVQMALVYSRDAIMASSGASEDAAAATRALRPQLDLPAGAAALSGTLGDASGTDGDGAFLLKVMKLALPVCHVLGLLACGFSVEARTSKIQRYAATSCQVYAVACRAMALLFAALCLHSGVDVVIALGGLASVLCVSQLASLVEHQLVMVE